MRPDKAPSGRDPPSLPREGSGCCTDSITASVITRLLGFVWAVLCLPNLGGPSLWDIDEGNNAECARGNVRVGQLRSCRRSTTSCAWINPCCCTGCKRRRITSCGINEFAARLAVGARLAAGAADRLRVGSMSLQSLRRVAGGIATGQQCRLLRRRSFRQSRCPAQSVYAADVLVLVESLHAPAVGGCWARGLPADWACSPRGRSPWSCR